MVVLALFGQGIARHIFGTTRRERVAAGGGGGGEAGTSTHARLGSAAAPRPCHCPSLLLGKGSLQTGAAAQADGIGIACQTVGPPCTASLLATDTLSEGGCPFSGSFVSVRGTHMGWGGA